jgi:hypothetical protein
MVDPYTGSGNLYVVYNAGGGCAKGPATFDIFEVEVTNSELTKLAAAWDMPCDGSAHIRGQVRFNSTFPVQGRTVTPHDLTFPLTRVGEPSTLPVRIVNPGDSDLEIDSVTVAGPDGADFRIGSDSCAAVTLALGESCEVQLQFVPTARGMRKAGLVIADSITPGGRRLPVAGRGAAPVLSIWPTQGMPNTRVGDSSGPFRFDITNTGDADLELDAVFLSGGAVDDFAIDGGNCVGPDGHLVALSTRDSCWIEVWFAPIATGARAANLTVVTNGGTGESVLSGTGVAPRAGYWMLGSTGSVYGFGDAASRGAPAPTAAANIASTPSGNGYWVVSRSGAVYPYGDASSFGGSPALRAGEIVSSISPTPAGNGYWLFTSHGRAFAYGAAKHVGDMGGSTLNGPVLGSVATPSGNGYYMVASDGGIFAFGDALFRGSMGGQSLNQPVVGLAPDPDGLGYWLVAADGGIFAFDAVFKGSMGNVRLNKPVVGAIAYGDGYLMVASDGGIFNFSSKPFLGSLGSNPPPNPVIAVATMPK